jgi:hypothetical protein
MANSKDEIVEAYDLGDRVVARTLGRDRAQISRIVVETRGGLIVDFKGSKISSVRVYTSPNEALEAAGLSE